MSASNSPIVIGTRKSALAMWQAEAVHSLLQAANPELSFQICGILSTGDKNLEIALSAFSDKGVFTKELDIALLSHEIDIAVHSMKDLPTVLPEGIVLGCVPCRGNVHDALVLRRDLPKDTPLEALKKLGSSSLRRRAMIWNRWGEKFELGDVRGNVNTRLSKLDEGRFDALVLASAGLERLGLGDRISRELKGEDWPYYAVCQGALAVVCRQDDHKMREILERLTDRNTLLRCTAERSMLRKLEGGCKVPIGVHSELQDGFLKLKGIVLSTNGSETVEVEKSMQIPVEYEESLKLAGRLGEDVAVSLLENGADKILAQIRTEISA